ncbi:hypothetical protein F5146DRAFT_1135220 [Armillaria mellea]|nr:hypothetical protein F5146DRAFT_1135220 [Armillaria mellea]
MSNYPFRHSTYYTRDDDEFISELPPMNTEEDLLQELQNYEHQARPDVRPPHRRRQYTGRAYRTRLEVAFQRLRRKLQNGIKVITATLRGIR